MDSLDYLRGIVDGAPENATLVDVLDDGYIDYMYHINKGYGNENIFSCSNDRSASVGYGDGNIRLLSDLKRIIELQENVIRLESKLGIE